MTLKITGLIRELGVGNSVFYLIDKVLKKLTFNKLRLIRYIVVAQPASKCSILPPRRGASIDVIEVMQGDSILEKSPVPPLVIEDRFKQGARCLVAVQKEEFIGYLWFISSQYMEDEVRLQYIFPRDIKVVWDFDVYVDPKCRLGFAFMRIWDEFYSILRDENVPYSYSRISAFNPASLASHKRLGAKSLFAINCFVAGSVQLVLASRTPFVGISIKNKAQRVYLPAPNQK